METTPMSVHWWMDKQNWICLHNRIFSPTKKWSTATCYNMGEPWTIMLSERPVARDHICFHYMKYQE